MRDYLLSVMFGVIQGLTEFLPVSSTAHLRLVKEPLGMLDDPYWKMYDVVIQLGSILAVVWYFRVKLWAFARNWPRGVDGDKNVFTHPFSLVMLAFLATSVPLLLGLADVVKGNLESLWVIGVALVVGGVVMWVVDVWLGAKGTTSDVSQVRPWQALVVGLVQITAAVFPGTSRSMSTIAGGQLSGMTRTAALEFSFFLAIPTMFAACGYDMLRTLTADETKPYAITRDLTVHDWGVLAVGFVVSFFVAWVVIAWFMAWVRRRGFVPFAIYRIVLGTIVLVYASGVYAGG